jgi:hypothetical protein
MHPAQLPPQGIAPIFKPSRMKGMHIYCRAKPTYDTPIPAVREVHSLEHGYIIIHYKDIPSDEVQQLAALVGADSWKMILSPLPSMAYNVSLTAWDHVQTCGGVDT